VEFNKDDFQVIDEYLDMMARSRGARLTKQQRTKVYDRAERAQYWSLWGLIRAKSRAERGPLLREFVQMARFAPGKTYPLPAAIIEEVINNGPEVVNDLYRTICLWFEHGGAHLVTRPWRVADLFDRLPRGLQVVYTLTKLEFLTYNAGISYAITSFADGRPDPDRFPRETYEDLRLVGAVKKAAIHKKAMALQERQTAELRKLPTTDKQNRAALKDACEAKYGEKFDSLDSAYYALEQTEPPYNLIVRYLQQHPEQFDCGSSKNRRKCHRPKLRPKMSL